MIVVITPSDMANYS